MLLCVVVSFMLSSAVHLLPLLSCRCPELSVVVRQVRELMATLDEDGDGEVDTREFIENMKRAKRERRYAQNRHSLPSHIGKEHGRFR